MESNERNEPANAMPQLPQQENQPGEPGVEPAKFMSNYSYHDVIVNVNAVDYKITNNYAYWLMCTRVGGWELWFRWDGVEKLIGAEFGCEQMRISVGNMVILDKPGVKEEEL